MPSFSCGVGTPTTLVTIMSPIPLMSACSTFSVHRRFSGHLVNELILLSLSSSCALKTGSKAQNRILSFLKARYFNVRTHDGRQKIEIGRSHVSFDWNNFTLPAVQARGGLASQPMGRGSMQRQHCLSRKPLPRTISTPLSTCAHSHRSIKTIDRGICFHRETKGFLVSARAMVHALTVYVSF